VIGHGDSHINPGAKRPIVLYEARAPSTWKGGEPFKI
jgi:hypothetical protein